MSNYRTMAIRQRKWMLILIALFAIGAGVMPNKHFFLGLLLGAGISFYNLWLLQRRTNLLGESAERDGSRKGIGTISRLAAAALGVLIAMRYDLSIIGDRKSTRLNSSHVAISYAVFCLKKKTQLHNSGRLRCTT